MMKIIKSGYFEDLNIKSLKDFCMNFLSEKKLDVENSTIPELRNGLFTLFDTDEFKKYYFDITLKASDYLGIGFSDLALQLTPTPRVYRPNAIGTSFHCDYWYGHGLESYTMWIPITELDLGNTFYVCDTTTENSLYLAFENELESSGILNEQLLSKTYPVLPSRAQSYLFKSTLIHGSPRNNSSKTRISFDFRFGRSNDPTSTKDITNYYHYIDSFFQLNPHPFFKKRILKYVCGGLNKNTFIQHIVIAAAAKRYEFNIYEEEAEIERYGYPVLSEYLNNDQKSKGLDGIVVASKSTINGFDYELIRGSSIKIWCALENAFAHEIL